MRFAIDHVVSYLSRTVFNPWLLLTLIPRILMEADPELFRNPLSKQSPVLFLAAAITFLTRFPSALLIIPPLLGLLAKLNTWLNFQVIDAGKKDRYDWPNEVAVVTGGSGEIGSATVRKMLEMGIGKVVIVDIRDPKPELIKDERVFFYRCDVSEYENVQKCAFKVKSEVGNPTILVLGAGIVHPATLISGSAKNIELTFKTNTLGALWALKCFVPAMIVPNHGHVLTITSQLGHLSIPMTVDYCASKAALGAIVEGFKSELYNYYRGSHIRFSSIAPGLVDTPLVANNALPNTFMLPWLEAEDMATKITDILKEGQSKNICFPIGAYSTLPFRMFPDWFRFGVQYIFVRCGFLSYITPRQPPLGLDEEMTRVDERWEKKTWDKPPAGGTSYRL
ncbi:NAD(P)-binding protein [Ascobolus immersus RN42]|uniref:NAD(P)-binding protein n=1 Tax=Ascobolus immersus RN42 TaxID=1160509 RepID=A0A3N4I5T9_ASCIM|nr:NAD(P)-binding protein [Ascobolus immersus RN42]